MYVGLHLQCHVCGSPLTVSCMWVSTYSVMYVQSSIPKSATI